MSDALRQAMDAGLPYTGLRGFDVDPRMWLYIPQPVALAQQVLPMTLIGGRLQVASATPEPDLSAIRRLYPALQIDVTIAPAAEIRRVLAQHSDGTDR